jgi:hypothetical protein
MMVADEIRALLLIHDRLNAWERPFIRDMAKRLEQRRSLTVKQLATVRAVWPCTESNDLIPRFRG